MQNPILLLVYKRPHLTQQVFDVIRQARPPRLYIAADGPRPDEASGDKVLCEEVRRIATAVNWPCEVRTLFRGENLGCRRAVSGALDWFFEQEVAGVIVEDDCLLDQSWFPFVDELLHRYQHDERVMSISASCFKPHRLVTQQSYFFSHYPQYWGWGSWRRSWAHYDHDMSLWPQLRDTDWLLSIGHGNRSFKSFWTFIFDKTHACEIDSWGYRWTFSCWTQHALTIVPVKNLVQNIGFGLEATHTKRRYAVNQNMALEKMEFPLIHPPDLIQDFAADRWLDINFYGINRNDILKQALRKLPYGSFLIKNLQLLKSDILNKFNR